MNLLFFGSGAFGLPTLERLCADHTVRAVFTQPSRPAGRKRVLTPTPVGAWAAEHGLPVHEVADVNAAEDVARVMGYAPDASVVIAFGQKLSPELIAVMGELAVNLHSSLLPKYRGAAPIHWAVLNGDEETGVSVIGLAQRMDAGAVYAKVATRIDPQETTGELHDRLATELGPDAVRGVLKQLDDGTLSPLEQDHEQATRARKLKKADGTVAFDQPAHRVRAWVHGLTPWPGCRVNWLIDHGGDRGVETRPLLIKRVKDHSGSGCGVPGRVGPDLKVACEGSTLELLEVQVPGGKPLAFEAFVRGHQFAAGHALAPTTSD